MTVSSWLTESLHALDLSFSCYVGYTFSYMCSVKHPQSVAHQKSERTWVPSTLATSPSPPSPLLAPPILTPVHVRGCKGHFLGQPVISRLLHACTEAYCSCSVHKLQIDLVEFPGKCILCILHI